MEVRALHDRWYDVEPRLIAGLLLTAAVLTVCLGYVIVTTPPIG
jgi:hypothetical protein